MASYTEYFYEYIENGNEMPSIFDSISSFNGKTFNVDLSNINRSQSATISGQEIDFGTGTIITNYFKGIDILNTAIEHLVINYYTI